MEPLPGRVEGVTLRGLKALSLPTPAATVEIDFRAREDFVGKVPVNVRVLMAGKALHSIWVTATVRRTVPVVHAVARLPRGHVLTAADLRIEQVDARRAPARALASVDQAVGMQTRASVGKGRPLGRSALVAPNVVERGALVTLLAGHGALHVSAPGRVEQAGPRDAFVRVTNLATKRVLRGRVIDRRHITLRLD